MAEFVNNEVQTVEANSPVLFTEDIVPGCDLIYHRTGSGTIKLFPINGKCNTRYKITFGGNLSIPSTGSVGTIAVAISLDGESIGSTTASVTPAAVSEPFNVATSTYVYIRHGCCSTISVRNISDVPIDVTNANIIVTRE